MAGSAALTAMAMAAGIGAAPSEANYCGRVPPGGYCYSDWHTGGARYGSMYTQTLNVPKTVVFFDLRASGTAQRVSTGCVHSGDRLRAIGYNNGTGSHVAYVTQEFC